MSAHTPGPWFASAVCEADDGFDVATVGPFDLAGRPYQSHAEDTICEVTGINHPCEANARLIAAAPDLLAIVRGVAALSKLTVDPEVIDFNLIDAARAAIAKAEGLVRALGTASPMQRKGQ